MSAQGAKPPIKIMYATMSGDQLEELHGALDAAIPAVQAASARPTRCGSTATR